MKNTFLFSLMMLFAMGAFAQNEIADCSDAQAIKTYLENNGFIAIPTTIVGEADATNYNMVFDYSRLTVLLDGQEVNITEKLKKDVQAGPSEGFTSAAFVTKNENFCDADIKSIIYNDFDKPKYDSSIDVHIWDNPNNENDLLLTRINPIDISKLTGEK